MAMVAATFPPRSTLMHSPTPSSSAAPAHAGLDAASVRSIVRGILLAMFLGALDQTVVATALPAIGHELGSVESLSWVVTAYLVAATAATPLYGKLSDIHGRRTMLLIGIGIFLAGSLAGALATSMPALIAARALQGIGGGGLMALAQTIVADIMSPRERGRYQAHFGAVFALASVAGPVIGGFLAEHLHWSVIFWINIPLGLGALAMTYRALALLPQQRRPHRLDVLGAALMTAATVTLLLALTFGGARLAWTSPAVAGLIAGSAALWVLFALRLATAAEPFLPLAVLGNPVVRFGTAAAFFGMGTMIGLSIYIPVYLQTVVGLSASHAGLALIPLVGGSVTGATVSGRVMPQVRHYKRLPLGALCASACALTVLALWPAGLPLYVDMALFAVIGLGVGSLFPVTTVAVQNAVRPTELGTATAAMNFFRQLGGAIIVAGFGALVLSGLATSGVGSTAEALRAGAAVAPALAAVFRVIFLCAAVGLAAAILFLAIMEERPLRDRPPGAAE
jgi:EmrB/QacA subfamily drug resistance transporter